MSLSEQEFRELVLLVAIGAHVRNGVLDSNDEYEPSRDEMLEKKLLALAAEAELPFVKKHADHYDVDMSLEMEQLDIIDAYDDDTFWDELEVRLGQRDFDRTMTPLDDQFLSENHGLLPDRIHAIYDQYAEEFEKYGIDRLEINKKAPVVSDMI